MSLTAVAICLVVGISDGDTLTARCGEPGQYQQVRVRLSAIDAPEAQQPFGQRSKQALSDMCYRVEATITPVTSDRYGRTVANVTCKGQDAGLSLVWSGMAWFYPQYGTGRADLSRAEREAREARRGLWVELGTRQEPIAPWDWRRAQRERKQPR